jgi:5-(carboxyamino)imidazole ribonucleotide synthase
MTKAVHPGSTIGVLGSGQLGRMFAIAARQMGYRVHVLSPDDDTPTGQVADLEIDAAYEDLDAVAQFARNVDVVSFEFENVPCEAIDVAQQFAPVRPAGQILHVTQHRLREKTFLRDAGMPVTPFHPIRSLSELEQAMASLDRAAVLKTAAWGYDGKGQQRVEPGSDLAEAWRAMAADEAILEEFVDFESELSVVAARGVDGQCACYAPIANTHANHILDVSVSPAKISPEIGAEAEEIARTVMEKLDVVGVLCVEFFLTRDGSLLINELAPRPHNSGHLTIDAHVTSQFEQQVRAVCGLGLGSTEQLRPAAMANLLGDLWQGGQPQWPEICAQPEVKLHLYGKHDPRGGRKMGHLTAVAETTDDALLRVLAARVSLRSIESTQPSDIEVGLGR